MDQLNIFEELYPTYKITKPIRLIELFAGYGSQALALKYLGTDFEHWKIVEWCYKSFDAYNRLHFGDTTDYSKNMSREELETIIENYGVSGDWNKPLSKSQIAKMTDHKLRKIYNDIKATHNMVDVSKIHAKDLEISDDGYCYVMTYSFPCQDLSLAGLRQGMDRGGQTRSGLLWEVERILLELKENGKLPDVLLMENVPQVHGAENEENFREWQIALEKMGYSNYWQDLIATDYGIPQIRNRTFMISILGDWFYGFPKPKQLTIKLKDMLEKEVDDKYYLSCKTIDSLYLHNEKMKSKGLSFMFKTTDGEGNAKNISTLSGKREVDNFIEIKQKALRETLERNDIPGNDVSFVDGYNRKIRTDDMACTIKTTVDNGDTFLLIKNATEKGYLEAEEGDGIDISSRMQYHRGTVQKGKAQTITCGGEKKEV